MVPPEITRALLGQEVEGLGSWATRHDWTINIDPGNLTLTAAVAHPATSATVTFRAELSGYPAVPPSWTCVDDHGVVTAAAFPAAGSMPGGPASIYHAQPVICAPWNRLAYADKAGPHGDWADAVQWKTIAPGCTRADTLPDMLDQLRLHLTVSPGMQA